MSSNKNDNPIRTVSELRNEVLYTNFQFKEHFIALCNIIPERSNERLVVEAIDKKRFKDMGLVYVLCISRKIFKIGCTITEFEKRVRSYNCGKQKFRNSGTCSTTNYFILQSLLNINRVVNVYAYFPEMMKYNIFGKKGAERFPSPKAVEKELIRQFINKHSHIPIGCTQR